MTALNKQVLVALFRMAQEGRPASTSGVANELGRSRRQVACALDELDRLGLVRAETVRLTLPGLARAAALRAARTAVHRAA